MIHAGENATATFTTRSFTTGALGNADALPTASLRRNGAADAGVTVTVTNTGTGTYSAAWTIPAGYAAGDDVELLVSATVGGVSDAWPVWRGRLVATNLPANVTQWRGQQPLPLNGEAVQTYMLGHSGYVLANVGQWAAQAVSLDNGKPRVGIGSDTVAANVVRVVGADVSGVADFRADLSGVTASLTTLLNRLTQSRADLLDKLNIAGNVAASAEVAAIQNNTRVVRVVPPVIERPDAGTTPYEVHLYVYDSAGGVEEPDAPPTVSLTNSAGVSRAARLDGTTMALVEPGHYKVTYTAGAADAIEQLLWNFTVTEGGLARPYGNSSLVVDTTAVDFTTDDRARLGAIYDKLPAGTIAQPGDAMALLQATIDAVRAGLSTLTAAQAQTAATDALTAYAPATAAVQAAMDAKLDQVVTVSGRLGGMLVADGQGGWMYGVAALANAPTGGADPAAIAAAVDTALTLAHGEGPWTPGAGGGAGTGDIVVGDDYGGHDLSAVDGDGVGIDGAVVRAYRAADFDAGAFVQRAEVVTGSDGRWVAPMMLDADAYVIACTYRGRTVTQRITVAE